MVWKVWYDERLKIVEMFYKKSITIEDILAEEAVSIPLVKEKKTNLFLCEIYGETNVQLSPVDVVRLAEDYDNKGLNRLIKFGIIIPNHEKTKVSIEFYKTACLNRGWNVEIFTDRKKAIEWLLKI